jgi:2-amino-4-hydroxy-6-hydroxymethyldihydropteridine diphosphokinase
LREKKRGFLSLGSNLGDRKENLRRAMAALAEIKEIEVKRVSKAYETAPMGVTEQPDFLNLVAEIETELSARELLAAAKGIEKRLGRQEIVRWGPRTIDIDILLLGEENIEEEGLHLPHPAMKARAFVMVPLAEIAPELRLDGEKAETIAARLIKEQTVRAAFQL